MPRVDAVRSMNSFRSAFLAVSALSLCSPWAWAEGDAPGKPAAVATPASEIVPGTPFKVDAAEEEKEATPTARVEHFFERLKNREVDLAYKEILRGSKIAETPKDVDLLQTKTVEALRFAGAITGADLVETRTVGVGGNLVGLTYLSLGKNFPLRWRFYFYRVEGAWRLIDIRISDRLPEMFKEGATPFDTKE